MRGSWTLVASVLAVSTAALSSTTCADGAVILIPCINQGKPTNSLALVGKKDEYSPRFDGLKFIETLVTAHRSNFQKDESTFKDFTISCRIVSWLVVFQVIPVLGFVLRIKSN